LQLANFDVEQFLRDSWQKKPLLIRDAWVSWNNPLDPDELAGLACEREVESRLVTQSSNQWDLEHGPFQASRFRDIGQTPWTLLVQAVDHYVPAVAALLEPFRFVPNWRVDDVMVSYAVDNGGVGAHFDQYDVFLVQGLGRRRWQIGARCDHSTPLLPHGDLRLLASFDPTDEWILGPGDILYVPPGVAHNGIAVGEDCMTYSIGFRAPSRSELIAGWAEYLVDALDDDDRYSDPGLAAQDNPGEISGQALVRLQQMIAKSVLDPGAFAHWFGEYSTVPKNQEIDWRPEQPIGTADLHSLVKRGIPLLRNPASRFSFIRGEAGALSLFVDGRAYGCTGPAATFAERLCAQDRVTIDADLVRLDETVALIIELVNRGSVAFELAD
jgi:50S ribosomal protein L16 3-hydroxylase